jgi:hypothetical protein
MTAFYLYAIVECPDMPVPAQPGLEEARLLVIVCRDLAAVISPFAAATAERTDTNLWRHEAVVEALMAQRAVLPVRFGTLLANQAAVRSTLAAGYDEFLASLERVRGRLEMGLHILCEEPALPTGSSRHLSASSGREYLQARLQDERRMQRYRQEVELLVQTLDAELVSIAAASQRHVLVTPRLLLSASYLVGCDRLPAFQQGVAALADAHRHLRFLCTGPWPPYSFVTSGPREQTANGGLVGFSQRGDTYASR